MKIVDFRNALDIPKKLKAKSFKVVVDHFSEIMPDYYGIAYPVKIIKGEVATSICYPIPTNLIIALYYQIRRKLKNPWAG